MIRDVVVLGVVTLKASQRYIYAIYGLFSPHCCEKDLLCQLLLFIIILGISHCM